MEDYISEKKVNIKKLIKTTQAPALGKWKDSWLNAHPGDPTTVKTGCQC